MRTERILIDLPFISFGTSFQTPQLMLLRKRGSNIKFGSSLYPKSVQCDILMCKYYMPNSSRLGTIN